MSHERASTVQMYSTKNKDGLITTALHDVAWCGRLVATEDHLRKIQPSLSDRARHVKAFEVLESSCQGKAALDSLSEFKKKYLKQDRVVFANIRRSCTVNSENSLANISKSTLYTGTSVSPQDNEENMEVQPRKATTAGLQKSTVTEKNASRMPLAPRPGHQNEPGSPTSKPSTAGRIPSTMSRTRNPSESVSESKALQRDPSRRATTTRTSLSMPKPTRASLLRESRTHQPQNNNAKTALPLRVLSSERRISIVEVKPVHKPASPRPTFQSGGSRRLSTVLTSRDNSKPQQTSRLQVLSRSQPFPQIEILDTSVECEGDENPEFEPYVPKSSLNSENLRVTSHRNSTYTSNGRTDDVTGTFPSSRRESSRDSHIAPDRSTRNSAVYSIKAGLMLSVDALGGHRRIDSTSESRSLRNSAFSTANPRDSARERDASVHSKLRTKIKKEDISPPIKDSFRNAMGEAELSMTTIDIQEDSTEQPHRASGVPTGFVSYLKEKGKDYKGKVSLEIQNTKRRALSGTLFDKFTGKSATAPRTVKQPSRTYISPLPRRAKVRTHDQRKTEKPRASRQNDSDSPCESPSSSDGEYKNSFFHCLIPDASLPGSQNLFELQKLIIHLKIESNNAQRAAEKAKIAHANVQSLKASILERLDSWREGMENLTASEETIAAVKE
ncbi:hypothetical protein DFH27DRAFT_327067 [Peziza echinospora]|nr:hypothetical protein DFH27DRAFT_327067 [Peziza echinospora]